MSRLLRLFFLTLLLTPLVFAQFDSGIQGTVVDSTSAVVPGVQVVVTNTGTGAAREAVTSPVGVYRVLNKPFDLGALESVILEEHEAHSNPAR